MRLISSPGMYDGISARVDPSGSRAARQGGHSMSQQMDWTAYGGNAAEIYERHMVPAIFGPWAEDLLVLAAPQAGERVLDVACGTGVVARLAAQRVSPSGTVVGLDLNPGMLTVARTPRLPPGAQIEWREGN